MPNDKMSKAAARQMWNKATKKAATRQRKATTPRDKMGESQRTAALRRKRGRMLGVEGPKGSMDGTKANRQAKAEYIRKKPRGDAARLKPRNTPARSYMNSGKRK
jgi:hypothetical protein